jgi:hypothetical protein
MSRSGIADQSHSDLRRAVARAAYRSGKIRLVSGELAEALCLVASMEGLYAVDQTSARLLCHGHFFGIAHHDSRVYAFEACDQVDHPSKLSRILRFDLVAGTLENPTILCQGLDNGCHQLTIVAGRLVLVDTYAMVLRVYDLAGRFIETVCPITASQCGDASRFSHMNSISVVGDQVHVMFHNGFIRPPRCSEVLVLDQQWQLAGLYELDGHDCHDILSLGDGRLLYCGSRAGELLCSDGSKRKLSNRFMRGLAHVRGGIVVGTTEFAPRERRQEASGSVLFLDADLTLQSELELPAGPTCILGL